MNFMNNVADVGKNQRFH